MWRNCNITSPTSIDTLYQSSKSLTSITIGFSLDPSIGSSGNSSRRKSLLHCCLLASVTVGDVLIGIIGVGDRRLGGGIGRGRWEEKEDGE